MTDIIPGYDTQLFLFLNSQHSPFFDTVMWYVSKMEVWIPFYITILFFIFKKYKWQGLYYLLTLILLVVLADQLSGLIKHSVQRLRPSHNEALQTFIHIVNNYRGGTYGFVSSHAANSFGFATFIALVYRKKWITFSMMAWALVVSYSRIYLGVHYPADIIGGAILGTGISFLLYYLLQIFLNKKTSNKQAT